ncbi:DNA recombination protein RmuC [Psychroserpens sp.]|uniref:DNA recombination protein RmuC n=1 Tax=Psychroserpens sp. TaxID=2020870 RepID=UPI001B245C97|nr:DNA recombination protein RmuC [Psychroserpens sp.]MBO6607063.1 DNA recombination protein RmuC [Psychroserpens sp.]MBO6630731.1 DNA recombination protein RmuC [Psychroserpens sp.]MBO6654209.1 DNA recombination protein RmuC [Psychroserpens sp.]MBO6682505.1 DNA recombination protein RmuC [Psychroserpens sp.]MBO6750835.1 DNA recombination protein RmuC [Psychroserpens sp.]
MNDNLILIFAIIISGAIGAYLGMLFIKLKSKSEQSGLEERQNALSATIDDLKQNVSKLENDRDEIRREKEFLNTELTRRNTEYENLQQQNLKRDEELEKRQEQLRKDFELLANKILEDKSEKFTLQNKENIKNLLDPLQEKIKGFEKKVEDTQKESISMHSALKEQLLGLKDLNQQMAKEATNLTKALKGDSKMQGNWGELVLERVLEKSGLEKDREYFVQQSFKREDGSRALPDVVLHLPDNKKMIIDSKVSLTHYERFVNADDDERQLFLKQHLNSIHTHIDQLSEKNYQDLYDIESPDFVLLFIPIEPAFAVAVNEDNKLYNKAFEKNIVIVTPSTLLATLRTIDSMWTNEKQQQNAIEIATQAGRLYDQFVNLTDDLLKVGNQLNTVKGSYDSTMKKLTGKGNLLKKVETIKKLGVKANKQINEKLLKKAEEESD